MIQSITIDHKNMIAQNKKYIGYRLFWSKITTRSFLLSILKIMNRIDYDEIIEKILKSSDFFVFWLEKFNLTIKWIPFLTNFRTTKYRISFLKMSVLNFSMLSGGSKTVGKEALGRYFFYFRYLDFLNISRIFTWPGRVQKCR